MTVHILRALLPWAVAIALGVVTYRNHLESERTLDQMCRDFWVPVCQEYGRAKP